MRPKRNNPQLLPIRRHGRKTAQNSQAQRKDEGFHPTGVDLSLNPDKFDPKIRTEVPHKSITTRSPPNYRIDQRKPRGHGKDPGNNRGAGFCK
jgi:hypothetical protein